MSIGKREQIVIGSIVALGLIAALHFLVFAESARQLKDAKASYDGMVTKVQSLRTLNDEAVLTSYTQETKRFLDEVQTGIDKLKLQMPEAFVIPKIEEIKLELPPSTPQGELEAKKKETLDKLIAERKLKQVDLVMAEIERLQAKAQDRELKHSFLGPLSWNVPLALPAPMQSGQLWDQIKNVAEFKSTLDRMGDDTTQQQTSTPPAAGALALPTAPAQPSQVRLQINWQYEQQLRVLGMDMRQVTLLRAKGEFVPLFYRLCLANLIMKQGLAGHRVFNEELTRETLLKILGVELQQDPIEGLQESKLYFAYEQLRALNNLLELAKAKKVAEVTDVVFRSYAFLVEQKSPETPIDLKIIDPAMLPDDEVDAAPLSPNATPTPDPNLDPMMMDPNYDPLMAGGMGMGMGGAPLTPLGQPGKPAAITKTDKDLGYALPIKLTFRAKNADAFTYVYDVLREKPMTELHRLVIRSMSQRNPADGSVEMTVTFLEVPKLFDTIENVKKIIEDIKANRQPGSAEAADQAAPPAL